MFVIHQFTLPNKLSCRLIAIRSGCVLAYSLPITHSCANGSSRSAQYDPLLSRLSVESYVIVLDQLHSSRQHTPLIKL